MPASGAGVKRGYDVYTLIGASFVISSRQSQTSRTATSDVLERVAFVPGAPFFAETAADNTIRLSYSLPSADEIDDGVARLARLIARQT